MIIVLLLLNLYVKMGIYEHDVFWVNLMMNEVVIVDEIMFKCYCCYLDICCC
jgi:hypothetical protein